MQKPRPEQATLITDVAFAVEEVPSDKSLSSVPFVMLVFVSSEDTRTEFMDTTAAGQDE